MQDEIDALTDKQAIEAIKLLYDFTPAEIWENNRKPSAERASTVADGLLDEALSETKPFLSSILSTDGDDGLAAKAELGRFILRQAQQHPLLRAPLARAIETARQRKLAIDPATGAFMVIFLLLFSKVEKTENGFKFEGGATVPKMLHELTGVIKALPPALFAKFFPM